MEETAHKINRRIIYVGLILFIVGVLVGVTISFGEGSILGKGTPLTPGQMMHPFTNPTITEELQKHFIINFKPLKDELIKIKKSYAQKTYIYFAYLNNS